MGPFLIAPLLIETPPKAADTAEQEVAQDAAAAAGPCPAAGPKAAVGEARHAAAATHAKDILRRQEEADGTNGRLLSLGMVVVIVLRFICAAMGAKCLCFGLCVVISKWRTCGPT